MKTHLRILYAEDNRQDAELTLSRWSQFAPDLEVEIVQTGQQCLERFREGEWDVLLLDYSLPDMDGLDVLRTVVRRGVQVPVVLVTGVGNEELVVKALRLGATSYVPKAGDYIETLPDLLRQVVVEHRRKQSLGQLEVRARRILYVEHVEMDIELTLRHFSEAAPHFQVDVVHTCTEALARLGQAHEYDVVLIDLRMPDQSGLDFVRQAKLLRFSLPPFVMISSMGDDAAAIAALKLGAAGYIAKRDGYLEQLVCTIDSAMESQSVLRLNQQLQLELTRRMKTEADLRVSQVRLEALWNLSRLDKVDSETANRQIVDSITMMTRSKYTYYGIIDRAESVATKLWYGGEAIETYAASDAPMQFSITVAGLWAEALKQRVPFVRNDFALPHPAKNRLPEGHVPITRCMVVPYVSGGKVVAVVVVANRDTDYEQADVDQTQAFLSGVYALLERKRAKQEREQLREQLQAAQKMEAIALLAGSVAHDFNNLLAVILGFTEIALEKLGKDDSTHSNLLQVQKAGEQAAAITSQLLAFSRKQVLQPKLLSLNDNLINLEELIQRIAGDDTVVTLMLEPKLGLTLIDSGRVDQVVANLVVNARDAMPRGGRLTIETANVALIAGVAALYEDAKPGRYVLMSITDSGCGMDRATQARLFEPFFTTKEKGKGTGLGLATVHGIVKQSGGFITVHSELGQGTTLKLFFPCRSPGAAPEPLVSLTSTSPTGTETILVVDDTEEICALAESILSAAGYTVVTASTGVEALEICASHQYKIALALVDVMMPSMSGKELADRLAVEYPAILILFISGYAGEELGPPEALNRDIQFLQKPFSSRQITRKVREVLDSQAAGPGEPDKATPTH